jgi:PadR family transcriptional regulator PadR
MKANPSSRGIEPALEPAGEAGHHGTHDHHEHHSGHGGELAHQGWTRSDGRRGRWLEPFLLLLVAEGDAHGYAITRSLNELRVAPGEIDAGTVYRVLRELEADGMVASAWEADVGAPRRSYTLTDTGRGTLDEWAAVMAERARLTAAFAPRYARVAPTPDPEGGTA